MAFNLENFTPASAGANSNSPRMWSYDTTDLFSTAIASGYFNNKINEVQTNDFLMLSASDNSSILVFTNSGTNIEVNDMGTTLADGPQLDAFNRLRTSGTGQRLDVEFIYDKQDSFFDEVTNGASASVTHNTATRDLTLKAGSATNAEFATMASHPVPYTPGNSQLIDMTGVLDLAGIGSGTAEVFLRSSVTGSIDEETIEQSAWTNATTGVDWTNSQLFQMDFQSLKVGRIRFNMIRSGMMVNVAEMTTDNERSSGFWQLPSLPAYWKIYNNTTDTYMECGYGNDENAIGFRYKITANASATMKAICCTVKSEGGLSLANMGGLSRSIDRGVTELTISTKLIPLISIRPKTTFQSLDNLIISLPKSFSITTDNPIKVVVLHDTTLTSPSWTDVDTSDSSLEYDVSATALAGGHTVFHDYVATAKKNEGSGTQGLLGKTVLWNRQNSVTGVLTLAAIKTGTTDGECLAGFNWEEIR